MKKYNPQTIEKKWQKYWDEQKTFVASDNKTLKKYVLIEFPYPSGEGLHMGHLRPYVAGDVYSRFARMSGFETVYPIGWDAFGLPAENYAIKNKVHPRISTAQNIKNAKRQINSWGIGFDWSREVNTTDPNYYKWTQWIFLQFFKAGLAYEKTGLINWCPKDKTGLANEEVINGHCERCGSIVEKREMRQWYLKITAYAEKLLDGLKDLDWPEPIKLQQANWIGKSEGAEIEFGIKNHESRIKVFTTRVDTIFGATYLVVAPEHTIIHELENKITNLDEVKKYVDDAQKKSELDRTSEGKEKTGVELKGVKAINPATKEEISVWVADYVLGNYGTGAIMAVPAHDERDFEFAKKYSLPIKQVVMPETGTKYDDEQRRDGYFSIVFDPTSQKYAVYKRQDGFLGLFAGGKDGEEDEIAGALREITEESGLHNFQHTEILGKVVTHFYNGLRKLNRVGHAFSILAILENADTKAVQLENHEKFGLYWTNPEELLASWEKFSKGGSEDHWVMYLHRAVGRAIELGFDKTSDAKIYRDTPFLGHGKLVNSGEFDEMDSKEVLSTMSAKYGKPTVQYKLRDWVFSRQRYWGEPIPIIHCPKDGVVAVQEDQLPVLLPEVEKYEPTGTGESPLANIDEWVNVKCPKCGADAKRETNTMPQWAGSSWYFLRYTDPDNDKQFAAPDKLKHWMPIDVYFGGMEHTTLHLLYSRFWNQFLFDQKLVPGSEPYLKRVPHGIILAADGEKMSKSRGNVVNPDDIVKEFGADTLRMYELFLGPHDMTVSWNDKGIVGVKRFLDRVHHWFQWTLIEHPEASDSIEAQRLLNRLTKKITEDIENFKFNTAISSLMGFHNQIVKENPLSKVSLKTFLILLYPFAPHISEELNELLGGTESLQLSAWPKYDPGKLVSETVQIIVQVNGKTKDKLQVATGTSEDELKQQALDLEKVKTVLAGGQPKRIVVVPGRLINIVM